MKSIILCQIIFFLQFFIFRLPLFLSSFSLVQKWFVCAISDFRLFLTSFHFDDGVDINRDFIWIYGKYDDKNDK